MLFRRKEPEIVTLTVVNTMEEAEAVIGFLAENGIRAVVRDRGGEEEFMIVSGGFMSDGIGIVVNGRDAERAAELFQESGFYEESEELTDEELEELAMSMAEITGLEEEEPDESDRLVAEWMR